MIHVVLISIQPIIKEWSFIIKNRGRSHTKFVAVRLFIFGRSPPKFLAVRHQSSWPFAAKVRCRSLPKFVAVRHQSSWPFAITFHLAVHSKRRPQTEWPFIWCGRGLRHADIFIIYMTKNLPNF